jgi:hypothetical protein
VLCRRFDDLHTVAHLAPWMTLGKGFSPFSFRHVLAPAATNLNTISLAVFGERAPFVRTVR